MGLSPTATMKQIGKDWRALSQNEQEDWALKAEVYNKGNNSKPVNSQAPKKSTGTDKRRQDAPVEKRKPLNGYTLYMKERNSELKSSELPHREKFGQIAKEWRKLKVEEKSSWNKRAEVF